jgi:hypothetical protein
MGRLSRDRPACWWKDFGTLVGLTVPNDGALILLSAYFDASGRAGGAFSVAGFAFGPGRAKKAASSWHRLWRDTPCHMTDLHTRMEGSDFEGWTKVQAGKRLKDSVAIINRYASNGVAVSCDLKEMNELAPRSAAKGSEHFLDGFESAYATCSHLAMFSLGKMLDFLGKDSSIAYFFEAGDDNQAAASRFWSLASRSALKQYYRHHSHTVIGKEDCRLLEMSDIFAWEWAKHRERISEGRHERPSLTAILGKGFSSQIDFASDNRRAIHLTGKPLKRYFDQVKTLILS